MTGNGVPALPPIDNSSEPPQPHAFSLTRALEHAYYARNREEFLRLAWQAEQKIAQLAAQLAALNRAGPAEMLREAPTRGVASVPGPPAP